MAPASMSGPIHLREPPSIKAMLGDRTFERHRRWAAFAAALVLPTIGAWLRLELEPILGDSDFILFLPAISLAAFVGGWAPGMVAVVASAVLSHQVIEPLGAFTLSKGTALGIFILVGVVQVWLL